MSLAPLDPEAVLTFLQDCDLVKFARLSPANDEAHAALETVREFVETSKPRELEAEAEAEAQPEAEAQAEANRDPTSVELGEEPRPRASRPEPPQPPGPTPSAQPDTAGEPESSEDVRPPSERAQRATTGREAAVRGQSGQTDQGGKK